ncbi:Saccharopine dehydrogenase [Planoprotostelium fungivorum]|uniref:Saccharopine dehydrogenase n=1 Tax=Planoprotostelium fungivorum TaxID=1890364 RepID=A0A2P6NSY9_9EUKA|nr:Saccharopine dehydrogenase [Planoprotostelium fungivorum]
MVQRLEVALLILQYLKEENLNDSLETFKTECRKEWNIDINTSIPASMKTLPSILTEYVAWKDRTKSTRNFIRQYVSTSAPTDNENILEKTLNNLSHLLEDYVLIKQEVIDHHEASRLASVTPPRPTPKTTHAVTLPPNIIIQPPNAHKKATSKTNSGNTQSRQAKKSEQMVAPSRPNMDKQSKTDQSVVTKRNYTITSAPFSSVQETTKTIHPPPTFQNPIHVDRWQMLSPESLPPESSSPPAHITVPDSPQSNKTEANEASILPDQLIDISRDNSTGVDHSEKNQPAGTRSNKRKANKPKRLSDTPYATSVLSPPAKIRRSLFDAPIEAPAVIEVASRISESIDPNNPSDLPETLLDDIYNLLYNEQSAPTMWSIPEAEVPQGEEMATTGDINYSESPANKRTEGEQEVLEDLPLEEFLSRVHGHEETKGIRYHASDPWCVRESWELIGALGSFPSKFLAFHKFPTQLQHIMGKSVLILGAGLSSPPLSKYLVDHGIQVTIANRTLASAEKLASERPGIKAIQLDIETEQGIQLLDQIAPQFDAVVSMLPYLFHVKAAELALRHKVHFFTTSYVSEDMKKLDKPAQEAGVIVVNECGVDPGTDHMSAMKLIHEVERDGGVIKSFTSYCGGLPAPKDNNNPFGYKVSWAPRGVLLASRNPATFLRDGKVTTIPGGDLFDNFHVEEVDGVGQLETYPNRNSEQYIDIYGIKQTRTLVRGTYRYPGWCQSIKKLSDIGYLSVDTTSFSGLTLGQLTANLIKSSAKDSAQLKKDVAQHVKLEENSRTIQNIEWMGLFDFGREVPQTVNTTLDVLNTLAKEKWVYAAGEVDMLVLKHTFEVEYPDRVDTVTSTMVDYGIPNGETSMSRTVSLPVAIAIRLVFEGKIALKGLQIPIIPEFYVPILAELETYGIKFVEKVVKSVPKNKL